MVEDVPCIEPFIKLHEGDAGFRFSICNGPLDGCCPAVFGKKGCVNVDAAVFGQIQDGRGEEFAVGADDDDIWFECFQGFTGLLSEFPWLVDFEVMAGGAYLDRWGGWCVAAPFGLVGLAEYGEDFMSSVHQPFQVHDCEIGGTHENNSHQSSWGALRFR